MPAPEDGAAAPWAVYRVRVGRLATDVTLGCGGGGPFLEEKGAAEDGGGEARGLLGPVDEAYDVPVEGLAGAVEGEVLDGQGELFGAEVRFHAVGEHG